MALRLFDFQKSFMIEFFWIKLTQLEKKLDYLVIFLFRWEICKLISTFETRNRSRFS